MKTSEVKLIQKHLAGKNLYWGDIDGKRGEKTNKAINTALLDHTTSLPDDWQSWNNKRKAVAYLQLLCKERDIDAGKIDGFYGPQTETAASQYRILVATGSLPRGFGDISTIRANPNHFPLEVEEELNEYYGKPGEGRLVKIRCPWELRLDWDLTTTTNTISIHERLGESLESILQSAYELFGNEGIRNYGLDRYGGSFNLRKKRGSLTKWSTHAWGVSVDWFPSRNKLKWNADKASLAQPDLDAWWEIWEKEGWVSLGRTEDRDWMHVQAAKR